MRALLRELQDSMQPMTPEAQEGIWKGIKKAASTAADVADTAISTVPVVGDVYNAGIGAYKATKATYHGGKALGLKLRGKDKEAGVQAKKAASAGVDALGRGAMAAASTVGMGGAAKLGGRALLKPLVKAAVTTGVNTAAKAGMAAGHSALSKKPAVKPVVPGAKPVVPLPKKKSVLAAPSASESVLFQSARALVEFRSMVGLPITLEHQKQLEAEEALDDAS